MVVTQPSFTLADVDGRIQSALSQAIGAQSFYQNQNVSYAPVYQQISNQADGSAQSAANAISALSSSINTQLSSLSDSLSSLNAGNITSGTLAVGNGGTGTSTIPTFGKILVGNNSGGYDLVSTSSMNITSTGFSGTTDDITQGLSNLYYNNSLVNSFLSGSSTIPKTYAANTFTGAQTFNGAVTANSSLTAGYITATSTTVASVFPMLRDGEIADQHSDGSWTYTIATTSSDIGRGNALLTAISQAQNGDNLYLYPIELRVSGITR